MQYSNEIKIGTTTRKRNFSAEVILLFYGPFQNLEKKEKSFRIVNITVVVVIKLVQKAFKGISARETAIEKTQKISRFVRYYYMQVPRGMSSIIRESFTYHQKNGKRKTKVIQWYFTTFPQYSKGNLEYLLRCSKSKKYD